MGLLNLTDHVVVDLVDDVVHPLSGLVLRITETPPGTPLTWSMVSLDPDATARLKAAGIEPTAEAIDELLQPRDDTRLIVSAVIGIAAATRPDAWRYLIPGRLERDEAGRVLGCHGLTPITPPPPPALEERLRPIAQREQDDDAVVLLAGGWDPETREVCDWRLEVGVRVELAGVDPGTVIEWLNTHVDGRDNAPTVQALAVLGAASRHPTGHGYVLLTEQGLSVELARWPSGSPVAEHAIRPADWDEVLAELRGLSVPAAAG